MDVALNDPIYGFVRQRVDQFCDLAMFALFLGSLFRPHPIFETAMTSIAHVANNDHSIRPFFS